MNKLKSKLIAWLTKDVNLIYTSKGNLPITELKREVKWHWNESQIAIQEIYTHNGEMVKDGVDVLKFPDGTHIEIEQGKIG